jgi:branched-chain amino acid aminotransferase, group II
MSLLRQGLGYLRLSTSSTSPSTTSRQRRVMIHSSALTIDNNKNVSSQQQQQQQQQTSSSSASLQSQSQPQPPKKETLKFGQIFSPHMLTISYSNHQWHDPKIVPYGPLSISPGSACLNYGMTCFEGMKAYRSATNNRDILLFRPDKNMERLSKSMERLSLPGYDFDRKELIRCIMKLVHLDQAWIPEGEEGYSLYLRPNVIAMNENLGLSHPESLLLYVVTSPVGPYYSVGGFQPIRLWCEAQYVRAFRGGTGNCKIGGNYAPTMKPAKEAMQRGYSQVLWLSQQQQQPSQDHGSELFVTEVGAMNIFFVFYNRDKRLYEIVTPPLDRGDILPGVTRQSIIELVHGWKEEDEGDGDGDGDGGDGYEMMERNITMTEIQQSVQEGTLVEAFGAGTAAVVTPIECMHFNGEDLNIPATGNVTKRVWKELTQIQYGKVKGHPWSVPVVVE